MSVEKNPAIPHIELLAALAVLNHRSAVQIQVPLLDLKEQNAALETEFKAAFEEVLRSGYYISGPRVAAFEKDLAEYTGTAEAIAVSSGTDALLLSMMAMGIGPGDEVICPSFTFFATAGSIHRLGATPVFVDCDPITFNSRVSDFESAVTPKTKAVIPVHLFGQMAEMDPIVEFARDRQLLVIEDAAQALGSRIGDRHAGSIGDCGTFSFFPSKNLSGFGEGGAIITNDTEFAARCRIIRNHGMQPRYHHSLVGGNFRLDEIQGALLQIKLGHLDRYIDSRARNAAFYVERLQQLLGSVEALILPTVLPDFHHIWNQFTLRVIGEGRRDALREHLIANGIAAEIYYPVPLHRQECFASIIDPDQSFAVSDELAIQVLSIPIFPELKPEQLEHVVAQIESFFKS
ncbi:MAG: dTDP-4-amino-4,6-dideoxygalactose transaminase [Verrucomicrobiales bacterium]|jgi:dTDP-4-amino-4,6-dideoxygalactose transaminase